ncbi:MAG: glycosyltransferase family 4 protein [Actinomycetota bacterium]|nr:glycosyltransferase family 4 protein [Actinomycetota bacterium]
MRAVLVVRSFPKVSTTFILNKMLGLRDRDVDVHLVCWTSEDAAWVRFPDAANDADLRRRIHLVPTLDRPAAGWALARNLAMGTLVAKRPFGRSGLTVLLSALQPDVVHFEFGSSAAPYLATESDASRDERPVVVSFRGHDLNCVGLGNPKFYDGVWRRADALHCLGDDLWQRALRRGCPPSKPHVLIPPAVDTMVFVPDPRPLVEIGTVERPLHLLSVGRLHWKKGHRFGLAAIRSLRDRGIMVEHHVIGDGPDCDEIMARAHDLGVTDAVRFLGPRSRSEVMSAMQWADAFLHPSVSEGFCNAVMEAQSMELPVVCSDADGLPENVADGVTGFVVPRRDEEAISDALVALARDRQLRARMGKAGRERVASMFRPEHQIDAFAKLYETVVDGRLDDLAAPEPTQEFAMGTWKKGP